MRAGEMASQRVTAAISHSLRTAIGPLAPRIRPRAQRVDELQEMRETTSRRLPRKRRLFARVKMPQEAFVAAGSWFLRSACTRGRWPSGEFVNPLRRQSGGASLAPVRGVDKSQRMRGAPQTDRLLRRRAVVAMDLVSLQSTSLLGDILLSGLACGVASAGLLVLQYATAAGVLDRKLNRKLVHISCAPLLFCLWPLYSNDSSARIAAAAVPMVFIARVVYSATRERDAGIAAPDRRTKAKFGTLARSIARDDQGFIAAVQGPVAYLVVFALCTLVFWRDSPLSALVLGQLCFGDGFADVFGRYFGKGSEWNLPWTGSKTVVGSLAFIVCASLGSLGLLEALTVSGHLPHDFLQHEVLPVLAVSAACGLVELFLSSKLDDNVTVPLATITFSYCFGLA